MKLLSLELERFRNHPSTHIDCSLNSNVFLGNNGEGKTNILEAISFLCLTKSFYASSDSNAMQIGAQSFRISGEMESDGGIRYALVLSYDGTTNSKRMTINKGSVGRLNSIVGEYPIVVLSPENSSITFGSPGDRRKFIDLVISQSSKAYFEDLLEYRKVLKQRNKILSDAKQFRTDCSALLEPWNESLATRGARIIHRRGLFVEEILPMVGERFTQLTESQERPSIQYQSGFEAPAHTSPEQLTEAFLLMLKSRAREEEMVGSTLVGPHRDELVFGINGLELRTFASQGQHKTFLVALKLAEFFFLKDRCSETPLLLLDDVFSELDERRSAHLLHEAAALGQVFITTTDDNVFRRNAAVPYERYYVESGSVTHGETVTPDHSADR